MLNLVFFSPEDLNIIKNGPGERRRFLDLELCQLDKIYMHHLTNYNKSLAQRNNLLKQISVNRELLDTLYIWDAKLTEHGNIVIETRKSYIEKINSLIYLYIKINRGQGRDTIRYEPNVNKEDFEETLKKTRERDLCLKMSSVGPHRDDMLFLIDNKDVRKYGSQGQQRTSALSLKLAELELGKETINDNPVRLLDDVLSELDRNRQNYLLNSIGDIQTIITCTGLEEFINNRFRYDKIFHVANNTVNSEN